MKLDTIGFIYIHQFATAHKAKFYVKRCIRMVFEENYKYFVFRGAAFQKKIAVLAYSLIDLILMLSPALNLFRSPNTLIQLIEYT